MKKLIHFQSYLNCLFQQIGAVISKFSLHNYFMQILKFKIIRVFFIGAYQFTSFFTYFNTIMLPLRELDEKLYCEILSLLLAFRNQSMCVCVCN